MAIWQGALLGPAHVSVSQPLCVCVDSYEAEAEASVIAVVRAFEFVQALRAKGLLEWAASLAGGCIGLHP